MAVIEHLTLRVPPDLKEQIEEEAHQDRTSINRKAVAILTAWFARSTSTPTDTTHANTTQS